MRTIAAWWQEITRWVVAMLNVAGQACRQQLPAEVVVGRQVVGKVGMAGCVVRQHAEAEGRRRLRQKVHGMAEVTPMMYGSGREPREGKKNLYRCANGSTREERRYVFSREGEAPAAKRPLG